MNQVIDSTIQIEVHPAQAYLNQQAQKTLLRFLTCGSVDDGKSSLIGRLLYETCSVTDSELKTLEKDSRKFGTTSLQYDFALLMDGLSTEREQGITIDVAYRYFSSNKRKFIVADTPGHEQYTRNMATGASHCDAVVIMLDATKGVLSQTKRHSSIASQLGIKKAIIAINKMDLVHFDGSIFKKIKQDYLKFSTKLNFDEVHVIPVCAISGCNIIHKSMNMPWYRGSTLLDTLDNFDIATSSPMPFALSVQMVSRPDHLFRGYAGRIDSGVIHVGDEINVLPSGKTSHVKAILLMGKSLTSAQAGQSITLTLEDELDISRGDVITSSEAYCEVAEQFQTTLLWMSETALVSSRQYIFQLANQSAIATPTKLKHKIDINDLHEEAAQTLHQNELGVCELSLNKIIAFRPYKESKNLGGFLLIDRITNETVACGFIDFALRRSGNIHPHPETVTSSQRAEIKNQTAKVIWLTGLSGSGKSTIANALEQELNQQGKHTMILDGDNIRHGLCKDLGFTEKDRAENIRRIAEVANLMADAGLLVIVSFISPFRAERLMAKELIGAKRFLEVFIDVPLAVAEKRDPKGLYKKARCGEIKNLTGIDSPYEKPQAPDVTINTEIMDVNSATDKILEQIMTL